LPSKNESGKPDAGWYEQVSRPGFERWWDGTEWSDQLRAIETTASSSTGQSVAADANGVVSEEPGVDPVEPDSPTPAAAVTPPRLANALRAVGKLPLWAKIVIPVAVVGIVVALVLGSRVLHTPSEADYRNGFSDIATALIANGSADWTQPAPYPTPLSASDQARFEQVKTVFLDGSCEDLAEGEDAMESKIDLAVAFAKDNGISVPYTLAGQEAMIEAAAKYICPRYSGEADKAVGYVLLLRVVGS